MSDTAEALEEAPATMLGSGDWMRSNGGWNGILDGARFGAAMSMSIYTTDAVGAFTQAHSHPSETITLLRQGNAEIIVDGERQMMGEGDGMKIPAGGVHSLRSLGPGTLEMITIHLGPQFLRDEA